MGDDTHLNPPCSCLASTAHPSVQTSKESARERGIRQERSARKQEDWGGINRSVGRKTQG